MNPQIKRIILNSGLFEEEDNFGGLFFAHKLNYDSVNELNQIIEQISKEYQQSVENWRDADIEVDCGEGYVKGYQDACDDILAEIRERFK
jgi:hypothetical protein